MKNIPCSNQSPKRGHLNQRRQAAVALAATPRNQCAWWSTHLVYIKQGGGGRRWKKKEGRPACHTSVAIFICRFPVTNTRWYTWWGRGLAIGDVIEVTKAQPWASMNTVQTVLLTWLGFPFLTEQCCTQNILELLMNWPTAPCFSINQ